MARTGRTARGSARARLTRPGLAAACLASLALAVAAGCRCGRAAAPTPAAPPPAPPAADPAPRAAAAPAAATQPAADGRDAQLLRRLKAYAAGGTDLDALRKQLAAYHEQVAPRGTPPPSPEEARRAWLERLRFVHACWAIRDDDAAGCGRLAPLGTGPAEWCELHVQMYRSFLGRIAADRSCDVAAAGRAVTTDPRRQRGVLELCAAIDRRDPARCPQRPPFLRVLCRALILDDVAQCDDPATPAGARAADGDCRELYLATLALRAHDPTKLAGGADASAYVGAMLGQPEACERRLLQSLRAPLRGAPLQVH